MTASQYISAADGAQFYVMDWKTKDGRVAASRRSWPLNSDSCGSQMQSLAENVYQVVVHDRRGHGRSGQTWPGDNMDEIGAKYGPITVAAVGLAATGAKHSRK